MPEASLPSIDLQLGRSVIFLRLALVVHLCAAVLPLFSAGGFWLFVFWPLIFWSFLNCMRRDYWRSSSRSISVLRFHQGRWSLHCCGQWVCVTLFGERLVTPSLTVMRFRGGLNDASKTWVVVIFQDAVSLEAYRQLRVHLLLY